MKIRDIHNFLFGTLRGRLIIGVTLVLTLTTTFFIIDLTVRQRSMLLAHQEEHAMTLSQTLSTSAAGWLAADDIAGLQELVEAQRRYPELDFAILADKDGLILSHTDKSRMGQFLLDLPGEARQTVISRTADLVDVATPAMLGGRHVGWTRVGIGQKSTGKKLAEITRDGILYALAAIFIGSVIALLMGRRITKRLYAVQSTINEVRSGNRSARSQIAGTDEAAMLALEFNAMLDTLSKSDAELDKSEIRFGKLFNVAAVPLCFVNKEGVLVDFNRRFVQTLGYTREDVPTLKEWWQLAYPDPAYRNWVVAAWESAVRQALEKKIDIEPIEYRVTCKSGEVRTMVISGTAIGDDLLLTFFDITERKRAEDGVRALNADLERRVQERTKELQSANVELEEKSKALGLAYKYKSEFLAKMSHELRTPLNSLLILAQLLSANKGGNLTDEQVEFARIIHNSGGDLLNLINEILDLSKIEAGQMNLQLGTVRTGDLADAVHTSFGYMAEEKGLKLEVTVRDDAPSEITSDQKHIEQIIRNLVANAIKFTDSGSVTVTFSRPSPHTNLSKSGLSADECLSVEVKDTGIGIAPENQKIIFEAFHQVDVGTTRQGGGTGLGLSISLELSRLLGGEIRTESELGTGSTFTLYLPVTMSSCRNAAPGNTATVAGADEGAVHSTMRHSATAVETEDDRDNLNKDDRVILVIEDDQKLARLLYGKCHEKGFKCLSAPTGEAGLELAGRHLPNAVILDICLPGMDGWDVLSALKENTDTRHIPVHIISAQDASAEMLLRGAAGHSTKPPTLEDIEKIFLRLEQVSDGKPRRVLLVDGNAETRRKIVNLIGDEDVRIDEVETGNQTLEVLRSSCYDCVILDFDLPDMDGLELLGKLESKGAELPPVIVHACRELTPREEMELRKHTKSIAVKDVKSEERLLDEVSLFLHRTGSKMPEKQRKIIRDLHDTDKLLRGKKVLIIDDDMRTTFALSRLLSDRGMETLKAENGERALRLLGEHPDVNLVLMDIMMPVMDGYETMKLIRVQERFRRLPIIALTAKAMPEDRMKCLAAGANDYLRKPVDPQRLFSMMCIWLYR